MHAMPTQLFLDSMTLECEGLEPVPADLLSGSTLWPGYPFPALRRTGAVREVQIPCAILSNDFAEITVALGLGGRILSWKDKRSDLELLPRSEVLELNEGGPRGFILPAGLTFGPGIGALGPVDYQLNEPNEVLLSQLVPGVGLSWQARLTIHDDSPQLEVEVRYLNRTAEEAPCPSEVRVFGHLLEAASFGAVAAARDRDAALSLTFEPGTFDAIDDNALHRRTHVEPMLAPRHTDVWRMTVTSTSGLPQPWVGKGVALALSGQEVVLQASEDLGPAKLLVQMKGGAVMEAPLQLQCGPTMRLDLSGLPAPAERFVVRSGTEGDLLDTGMEVKTLRPMPENESHLRSGSFRALGHLQLAAAANLRQDYPTANQHLEDALLYSGDDHLTWWLKGRTTTHLAEVEEEQPELLNAHYLAPLEPALRAEAFLAQSPEMGAGPNPLVKPLADDPEALLDVCCHLAESGLHADAMRLADEGLRHREHPALRLLVAWMLMQQTHMQVEAADQVRKAEEAELSAPYPWRAIEQRLLNDLVARFPDLPKLRRRLELVLIAREPAASS